MKLINENPFRVIGVPANATERELQKQKAKLRAYIKVGKSLSSDLDFEMLKDIERTEELIENAFSRIEQNQDKVNYALFWFLNANTYDKTAIEYLKIGNKKKAAEIWEKITNGKAVNSKNFSCFNNLGTYKLLSDYIQDIVQGIRIKIDLIESNYLENFINQVADKTYKIDNNKLKERFLDNLYNELKNKYSNNEILQLFQSCEPKTLQYIKKKLTEEPIYNIERLIESTKRRRKENKYQAYIYGKRLYENTKKDLIFIKSILGKNNLKYKSVADQLANEILQCGIDYFNESKKNDSSENYFEKAKELSELADTIAAGGLIKDRIKDNLTTLEELKDEELNRAIVLLKSIKDAYELNEMRILSEVYQMERNMPFNYRIDWSKVDDLIKNSIDWDKVVGLILNVIPEKNIEKIRKSNNKDKLEEYRKLVVFVIDKMGYYQKGKIKYLQYWNTSSRKKSTKKSAKTNNKKKNSFTEENTQTYSTSKNKQENMWVWIISIIILIVLMQMCH